MPSSWDEPQQTKSSVGWFPIVLAMVVMLAIGNYLRPIEWKFAKPDGDKKEQVEPSPSPSKLEKGSHVIVVEETEDRIKFPFISTIQSDRAYWDALKAREINWGFYDAQASEVESYKADFTEVGLPALLVISPAGRVLFKKSLPPTTDSIDEALRSMK